MLSYNSFTGASRSTCKLTYVTGRWVLENWFFSMWVSQWGYLSVLMTWHLASPRVSKRNQGSQTGMLAVFYWSHRPALVHCEKGLNKCMLTKVKIIEGHFENWVPQFVMSLPHAKTFTSSRGPLKTHLMTSLQSLRSCRVNQIQVPMRLFRYSSSSTAPQV